MNAAVRTTDLRVIDRLLTLECRPWWPGALADRRLRVSLHRDGLESSYESVLRWGDMVRVEQRMHRTRYVAMFDVIKRHSIVGIARLPDTSGCSVSGESATRSGVVGHEASWH